MEREKQGVTTMEPVLVAGATGKQGGAVARALLRLGVLVRDPSAPKAEALKALGAELVKGDLNNIESLRIACAGVRSAFSVQMPDLTDPLSDVEKMHAKNLVDVAKSEGVTQFVHSSSSGTKEHRSAPGWAEGRWHKTHMAHYWESKAAIEDFVREAGFDQWTIIRPSFFMENFIRPSFLFANWTEARLLTAIRPDTRIAMVAVDDIGVAGATAIAEPDRFDRVELELASDVLNMTQIASVLSDAMGVELSAPNLTADEAIARGMMPVLVYGQDWTNEVPAPAKPEFAHAFGLPTTSFQSWALKTLEMNAGETSRDRSM